MPLWRRQLMAFASRNDVPFVSSRRCIAHQYLLLHTQAVHWTRDDDAVERCQLVGFRPFDGKHPLRAVTANDVTRTSTAIRHLRNGRAVVYTGGDYHNARQLLQAVKRKCDGSSGPQKRKKRGRKGTVAGVADVSLRQQWIQQRQMEREKSVLVGRLLMQVSVENGMPTEIMGLKRAPPNAKDILSFAFQNDDAIDAHCDDSPRSRPGYLLLSINDFLAMTGGYEWNRRGVYIDALQDYIYPHFGVFPPTRQDYIQLLDCINVDRRPQRGPIRMMEVGIGTGVLSMVLLQKKVVDRVIVTDINPCAIACSKDNMKRFGLQERVDDIIQADLFPPMDSAANNATNDKVDVVLFNPPWMPGDATTLFESAVYDPNQSILRRFLLQVQHHVREGGQIYLLLSNLGVLLGLYQTEDLYGMFDEGNLELVEVHETQPKAEISKRIEQAKSTGKTAPDHLDGIASARAQEVISLYQLRVKDTKGRQ